MTTSRSHAAIARELGARQVMIGGATYFMRPLEEALLHAGIQPLHTFTRREAVDRIQDDGSVKKEQRFVHAGFVRVE